MKKFSSFLIAISICLHAYSQQPPVNDTLIPKQHRDDTTLYEPKLQGGALIDTVNIDHKPDFQPGYLKDSLNENNRRKKPKGN